MERTRRRNAFARNVLDAMLDESSLNPQDKAFATRLVLGVVSTLGTLDAVLDRSMRTPDDVNPDVRTALRISAYEMLFLGKAHHAVVDQGVELVRFAVPKAAKLANAVLRKLAFQAKGFPFGEPDDDIRVAALEQGFPVWMAARLEEMHGASSARDMMRACNEDAPIFIAVNSMKASDDDVLSAFSRAGASLVEAVVNGQPVSGCFWLPDGAKLHDPKVMALLAKGKILVSDAASQTVVLRACREALAIKASRKACEGDGSHRISALELCCGRGTKTILLQDRMNRLCGEGFSPFLAVDNVQYKVDVTKSRLERFGIKADGVICADAASVALPSIVGADDMPAGGFDMVFVDAPCSGTGTLRRHPEIRWKLTYDDVLKCARSGLSLLKSASALVAPGGVLAHSTCSMEPEEDEVVVEAFLRSAEGADFEVVAPGPVKGVSSADGLTSKASRLSSLGIHTSLHSGLGAHGHPSSDSHFLALMRRRDK